MMKKAYLFILCILTLLLLLSACTESEGVPQPSPDGDGTLDGDGTPAVDPTDDDYLDITPPPTGALQNYTLVFEGVAMTAPLPKSWRFEEKENGGYDIFKDGFLIGRAESGDVQESGFRTVYEDVYDMENGVLLYADVEKAEEKGTPVFRHRLRFTTKDAEYLSATFFLPYEELDELTFNRIYREAELSVPTNNPGHGSLAEFSESRKVLILGNSFISSSQIGVSLQALFNGAGVDTDVVAISRGYAHVSTYVADSAKMQEIRNGVYDIIFICGMYSQDEIASLQTLRQICQVSDTPLVLFPAHNESKIAIDFALIQVKGIYYIPWREEINTLIASGVSKDDMCINDSHLHSTPLAGYVGAHMIYRALFGESPETRVISGLLTKETLEAKLGRVYLETGILCKEKKILIFS